MSLQGSTCRVTLKWHADDNLSHALLEQCQADVVAVVTRYGLRADVTNVVDWEWLPRDGGAD